MNESQHIYSGRWIFPVASPPLEQGTITIAGDKIVAVDPCGIRAPDVDLGDVAIIPGLVNVHTHLDLTGAHAQIPATTPDRFVDWLRAVIAFRKNRTPEQVANDVRDGLAQCLAYGTTLVGDITVNASSYKAVAMADMRATLFWEIIGLSENKYMEERRRYFEATCEDWSRDTEAHYPSTSQLAWQCSPHAPYSTHKSAPVNLVAIGGTIHLGESPGEMELLTARTGPFVPFLQELGLWTPEHIVTDAGVYFEHRFQRLKTSRTLYVHGNYLSPDKIQFADSDTLVYCPRTHAYFAHPRHPFAEFQARGTRVCLATDSLASNPDLDVLEEARFLHGIRPEVPMASLLRMITLNGAEALGRADIAGSLEPGKSADFVVLPLDQREYSDPYEHLFDPETPRKTRRTMFQGLWRV